MTFTANGKRQALACHKSVKILSFWLASFLWEVAWYLELVYTKTVDSVELARWLARQTPDICAIYLRATQEKMASRFASVTSEENIQINFVCVYYLTVLVYTKTTIYLSVGG